jgi:hypothetical protein
LEAEMNRGENNVPLVGILARVPYTCAGVTQKGRGCRLPATVHYVKADSTCVKHYCPTHAKGKGSLRTRLLLPRAWEYDHTEVYGA